MFARARLEPGSPEFETYYAMRPENRESDDRTRALPGLLSPERPRGRPVAFASAGASFAITEALRDEVDGPVAPDRQRAAGVGDDRHRQATGPSTRGVRRRRHRAAAVSRLHPRRSRHRASGASRSSSIIAGRSPSPSRWTTRRCARRPAAPVVAESARQYVESAKIAIQLAALIRSLGYPARAHIDGNYRVHRAAGRAGRRARRDRPHGHPDDAAPRARGSGSAW